MHSNVIEPSRFSPAEADFEAIVVGAGIGGLYQLYRLKALGLRVRLLEAGSDVGGAWFWNRYPGARFDSESYSYAYSFSEDLLQDWDWSEHFAPQAETLRYLQHVTDRFDLRRHIDFDSLVQDARFDPASQRWTITTAHGTCYTTRYFILAIGSLTVPQFPRIPGVDRFAGESHHTARWPTSPVSFEGKRVAVIGTGATGVQTIQEVAKTASHLTVFQRTPNFCVPLNNSKIAAEEQAGLKTGYPAIFERCRQTSGWFIHHPDPRSVFDVPEAEREVFFEARYGEPGLSLWQANFRDIMTDPKANAIITEFVSRKIRARVNDPAVAEKLIPKNHGFGTRRVPLETRYYEVYNQPNVTLVDLLATPIKQITETGIQASSGFHELDMIIYATGFDAITGSFDRMNISGVDGQTLRAKWEEGPESFLGLMVSGFPNMFMPGGPLSAVGNFPRALEYHVDWITDLVQFMAKRGLGVADAKPQAEREWTDHAREVATVLLGSQVDSWMTGVNTNKEGRQVRVASIYRGGGEAFRKKSEAVAANDYPEVSFQPLTLSEAASQPTAEASAAD
ncbi:MAG: flavin-containing monooxygenase [Janthinobacterium lividum]